MNISQFKILEINAFKQHFFLDGQRSRPKSFAVCSQKFLLHTDANYSSIIEIKKRWIRIKPKKVRVIQPKYTWNP